MRSEVWRLPLQQQGLRTHPHSPPTTTTLGDLPATAHEGASITKAPGWFAPSCGHHETLGTNPRTHGTAVVVDGTPWTMFEVIENWLANTAPTGVVSQQRGEGCP